MRMVPILSLALFLGAVALGSSPSTAQLAEPRGNCGGSYFEGYLKERGRKAFAYADDGMGDYVCGYGYEAGTADIAEGLALRQCRKGAKEAGISARCEIFARDERIVWQGQNIPASERDRASPREAAGLAPREEVGLDRGISGYAGAVEPFSTPILLRYRESPEYTGTVNSKATAAGVSSSVEIVFSGFVERRGSNLQQHMSVSEYSMDGQRLGRRGSTLFDYAYTIDDIGSLLDVHFDPSGLASELGIEVPRRGSPEYKELSGLFGSQDPLLSVSFRAGAVEMNDDAFSTRGFVERLMVWYGMDPESGSTGITSNSIAARARGLTYIDGRRSLVVDWSGAASGRNGSNKFRVAVDGYSVVDTATGVQTRSRLDLTFVGMPEAPERVDLSTDWTISFAGEADAAAELGTEAQPEPRTATRIPETARTDAPSMAEVTPAVPENRHAVAVIIGNKDYGGPLPDVDYAANDATAMRAYVIQMLGYREGNIIDLRDATRAQIDAVFGTRETHEGKLYNWVRAGESDVFVFYSGHGVPGLRDRRSYLLPVDGDPDLAEITGYPVDLLYENLAKIDARSITVFLDACFSGDSAGGILVRGASGLSVAARPAAALPKLTVITAAEGSQVASWDEDAKHGLFTEHLLCALYGAADAGEYGNGDGAVALAEVQRYLADEMTYQARRRYGRQQDATVLGRDAHVLVNLPREFRRPNLSDSAASRSEDAADREPPVEEARLSPRPSQAAVANEFDGTWRFVLSSDGGGDPTCINKVRANDVSIAGGRIDGEQPVRGRGVWYFSGSVHPDGRFDGVEAANGLEVAEILGRLSGSDGSGTYSTDRFACSGTWIAARTN